MNVVFLSCLFTKRKKKQTNYFIYIIAILKKKKTSQDQKSQPHPCDVGVAVMCPAHINMLFIWVGGACDGALQQSPQL